ncbi:hypothetical protein B0T21DRAFT_410835 [Apiosordaria backusii]|uniref:Uncharacterized protein n=1 Tax=Apiosordaria backusii TaxID=314023 RepID=A0AA40BNA9_9PEZI|nr:hypothetical protein B0T21DRAFT_410835 [Apiosordaria backusii]
MKILPNLDISKPKDGDLEAKLLSQLSYECLCRDHDDDDTAETLVGQWKTAFQKARSQYQKTQETPSKELPSPDSKGLARESSAQKETPSTDTSLRPTPASESASKGLNVNTQLQSPPTSSKESEGATSVSPHDSQEGASVPEATPSKSPEASKPTPTFDFTQLFKTPSSHKPTVNPQKSTPSPATFNSAIEEPPSKTPGASSTADRSHSSVPTLSPGESSPSFVFSSSSTPSKLPTDQKEEISEFERRLSDMTNRQSLESQRRWLKDLREGVDEQSRVLTMHGDAKEKMDEKVLRETENELTGLGESIERLKLKLEKGSTPRPMGLGAGSVQTRGEGSLRDAGSRGGSADEGELSDEGDKRKGEEGSGEKVGSMFDFSFQTPKASSGGLGSGGQSKF